MKLNVGLSHPRDIDYAQQVGISEGWMFRKRLPDFPRFSIMTEWKDAEPNFDKRVRA